VYISIKLFILEFLWAIKVQLQQRSNMLLQFYNKINNWPMKPVSRDQNGGMIDQMNRIKSNKCFSCVAWKCEFMDQESDTVWFTMIVVIFSDIAASFHWSNWKLVDLCTLISHITHPYLKYETNVYLKGTFNKLSYE